MKTNEETSLEVLKKFFRFWKLRKITPMMHCLLLKEYVVKEGL